MMINVKGPAVIQTSKVVVGVTLLAAAKMQMYVKLCNDEIGWLGRVTRERSEKLDAFIVEDVYLIEQGVHGATTELSEEGMAKFFGELLQVEGGVAIANDIKFWGHSHVNMGVFASGQDIDQLKQLAANATDGWYLGMVLNKKGEAHTTLAMMHGSVVLKDVETLTLVGQDKQMEEAIAAEIKQKVRKIGHVTSTASGPTGSWLNTKTKTFYAEAVKLYPGKTLIYCRKCDEWHPKEVTCAAHYVNGCAAEPIAVSQVGMEHI